MFKGNSGLVCIGKTVITNVCLIAIVRCLPLQVAEVVIMIALVKDSTKFKVGSTLVVRAYRKANHFAMAVRCKKP